MHYVSTRGDTGAAFADVLLGGPVNEPATGAAQEVIISDFMFTPVPEPTTGMLLTIGVGLLCAGGMLPRARAL